jgi:radical SAM protein with 4Fe4S-binding SPASM domain
MKMPISAQGPVTLGPAIILWEITSSCSHHCAGCGNTFKHSSHFIKVEDFKTTLALISDLVFDVRLTGGEPTLHPHLASLLDILEESGLSYSILSNGYWKNISSIKSSLMNHSGFRGFLISLHGKDAESHDKFVGKRGSFKTVTNNIKKITEAGFYVSTNTVLHNLSVNDIDEIIELSKRLGASYAVFNRYYGADPKFAIPKHVLQYAAEKITRLRKKGMQVRLGNCIPKCVANCDCDGCPAGNFAATIDPWLRLRPCNHAPNIVGNLHKQSLREIWHGDEMANWRNFIPTECKECINQSVCAGGCRAEAIIHGVDKDPMIPSMHQYAFNEETATLRLWKNDRFTMNAKRRKESFGELLYFEGEVLLLNNPGKNVIDDIIAGQTIQSIVSSHGWSATNIIEELVLRGFITVYGA